MLAQLPPTQPSPTSGQTWAAIATTIVGAIGAVLAKKKFSRPRVASINSKTISHQPISHSDFQTALDQMRDRVAAGYMALGQKMDSSQKEILSAIADHSSTVEKRLDALESAVARLDERTSKR